MAAAFIPHPPLPPTLQPSHSEQIFHLAQRIDQHLEVVEEKIDGMTVPAVMIRPPSPQETELTIQLEAQKRQMEAMMAMMETMRVEKEKQEQEAKKRVAQEEARELADIHKKLAETFYNHTCGFGEQQGAAYMAAGECGATFMKKLMAAGEIILYAVYSDYILCNQSIHALKLLITNRGVYSFQVHRENSRIAHHSYGGYLASGLHYMPVYTFDKPLNLKQTKMLSILTQGTQYALINAQPYHDPSLLVSLHRPSLENQKKFESIIRLIPGSYQNGDWRPMDGFFGLYFNETTMEVNEFPGRAL